MRAHLAEPLTIERLANRAAMSPHNCEQPVPQERDALEPEQDVAIGVASTRSAAPDALLGLSC